MGIQKGGEKGIQKGNQEMTKVCFIDFKKLSN